MGQAERRKAKGNYPEQTAKPRRAARPTVNRDPDPINDFLNNMVRPDPYLGGMDPGVMMMLGTLLMTRHSGVNFAMRLENARINRENMEAEPE